MKLYYIKKEKGNKECEVEKQINGIKCNKRAFTRRHGWKW